MLKKHNYIIIVVISTIIFGILFFVVSNIGYIKIKQEDGWILLKKWNNNIYVQEVNVQKTRIGFIDGKISDQNFQPFSLTTTWTGLYDIAYALTNGSFFDYGSNGKYNMSFPYKRSGNIRSNGWSTNVDDYIGNLRMLALGYNDNFDNKNYIAKVIDYDESLMSKKEYTDILVGLNPNFNKNKDSKLGRTFIGVKDYSYNDTSTNQEIKTNLVYILTGVNITQLDAVNELKKFGIDDNNIVMFDGGGSSQLFFEDDGIQEIYGSNEPNINKPDYRSIPQGILTLPRPKLSK